jgi:hypothetical protein
MAQGDFEEKYLDVMSMLNNLIFVTFLTGLRN